MPKEGSKIAQALQMVIIDGLTIDEAAKSTGYRPTFVRQALAKAEKHGEVVGILRAWREKATLLAERTIVTEMRHPSSAEIRLRASRMWSEMYGALKPDRLQGNGGNTTLIQVNIGGRGKASTVQEVRRGVLQAPEPRAIIVDAEHEPVEDQGLSETD
jgi:hypothetical protein